MCTVHNGYYACAFHNQELSMKVMMMLNCHVAEITQRALTLNSYDPSPRKYVWNIFFLLIVTKCGILPKVILLCCEAVEDI